MSGRTQTRPINLIQTQPTDAENTQRLNTHQTEDVTPTREASSADRIVSNETTRGLLLMQQPSKNCNAKHNAQQRVNPQLSIVPAYTFTRTDEEDMDLRKYLARRLYGTTVDYEPAYTGPDAQPLDISLDDEEGDVMAGISATLYHGCLYIDLLWVDASLRGQGIGRKLLQMAESAAFERGCVRARANAYSAEDNPYDLGFYERMGYTVTGKLQAFPKAPSGEGHTRYWLCKPFSAASALGIRELKGPA